jgi:predicted Ser/Thr protein kinase
LYSMIVERCVSSFLRLATLASVIIVVCVFETHRVMLNCVEAQQGANINHTVATLSQARSWLVATSSGDLVFFGGGLNATGPSDQVDICNVTSGSWTTATLSIPRLELAAASSGNLILFGGGYDGNVSYYDRVDMYNISDGSWTTANLSVARAFLAATSVGSLILFGGGFGPDPYNASIGFIYLIVDIYDVSSNTWTITTLSAPRYLLVATSVANRYAIFAGGLVNSPSNVVDIYDSSLDLWSTATLSQARYFLAATSLGNLAFFGGGYNGSAVYNVVDIFNSTTSQWSTTTLSQASGLLAAASFGDIVAFGGGFGPTTYSSVVDMYNTTSDNWFTLSLSQPRSVLAATTATNKIFFGGGANSINSTSNVVDIFDIPPPPPLPPSSPPIPLPVSSPIVSVSPVASPSNTSTAGGGLTTGAIVGIVVAVGVVLIAVGVLLFFLLFLRKEKAKTKVMLSPVNESGNVRKSDALDADASYTPLEAPPQRNIPNLSAGGLYFPTSDQSQNLMKRSQISFNEIQVEKELGEGSYGKVYLGKWNGAPVALKFCKKKGIMEEFLKEVKLMMELPPHPNVVHVFGVSLDGPQPIIIMEYCAGGSLDKLLFDIKVRLSDEQKIKFVEGIAAGMLHLHRHNVVHRDLAARNISLTATGDPKITDFGMSRVLQGINEGKTYSDLGPVRWMAPESLAHHTYSKKSDVWTFGIVVWEIVAQSEPHVEIDPLEVAVMIRDRYMTPPIPANCPQQLRELMEMCWKSDPDQRPTFETICEILAIPNNVGLG